MKKPVSMSLSAFLLFVLVFSGVTIAKAEEKKIYKLTFATTLPAAGWGAEHTMKPWFEQIAKATDGQVVIEPYWGGALVKSKAAWDALKNGIVDIADVSFHYWPGLVEFHNVITLPFLEYKNAEHEAIVAWKLYEQFPEIQDEYKDNKLLLVYTSTPFVFVSKEKQIKSMKDFNGMKVRISGGESLKNVVEAGGGIPTTVGGSEIYSALEKGVIDASMANWDMLMSFRFYEVVKYYFEGPWNAGARGVAMSRQAWDRLPADLQEKVMSVCGMEGSRFWTRTTFDESVEPGKERVLKEGYQIIETKMDADEVKEMQALYGDKIWNVWIEAAEKKAAAEGYPDPKGLVQKMLTTTQELIKTTAAQ
ncbi:TRAP transporter substrate-binding protein DctP [Desulfopila aestuarii]|uniref:TRAP-type C4-dicarboxylate transport system, substrate-binding protein n=1 Tax=Desulfopila aestuarii DSM 18488 TaxID=1121416 RepID=A0A1M7XY18_9BACT|nr:TRAP transporter substrate-binding protein DctP [Desulfopila aestuarii]SHO43872.1 TRAP-type C4-dicarboxylate transport system, substrate-binding protein [Desulfopila aestuarii DSM 18488]